MKGAPQGPAGQQLKGRATALSGSPERSCCRVSSLQPERAGGDPPRRKKGPGTRQKWGQGSWCAKEKPTNPSARTRAQVHKQCTEIRGQGKRGNLLKTHTVRREKSSRWGRRADAKAESRVIPKETEVAWSRKGRSLSMLGEKCNIKEIGEQTICGDFTILG